MAVKPIIYIFFALIFHLSKSQTLLSHRDLYVRQDDHFDDTKKIHASGVGYVGTGRELHRREYKRGGKGGTQQYRTNTNYMGKGGYKKGNGKKGRNRKNNHKQNYKYSKMHQHSNMNVEYGHNGNHKHPDNSHLRGYGHSHGHSHPYRTVLNNKRNKGSGHGHNHSHVHTDGTRHRNQHDHDENETHHSNNHMNGGFNHNDEHQHPDGTVHTHRHGHRDNDPGNHGRDHDHGHNHRHTHPDGTTHTHGHNHDNDKTHHMNVHDDNGFNHEHKHIHRDGTVHTEMHYHDDNGPTTHDHEPSDPESSRESFPESTDLEDYYYDDEGFPADDDAEPPADDDAGPPADDDAGPPADDDNGPPAVFDDDGLPNGVKRVKVEARMEFDYDKKSDGVITTSQPQNYEPNPPTDSDIDYLEQEINQFLNDRLSGVFPDFIKSDNLIDRASIVYNPGTGQLKFDISSFEDFNENDGDVPLAIEIFEYMTNDENFRWAPLIEEYIWKSSNDGDFFYQMYSVYFDARASSVRV